MAGPATYTLQCVMTSWLSKSWTVHLGCPVALQFVTFEQNNTATRRYPTLPFAKGRCLRSSSRGTPATSRNLSLANIKGHKASLAHEQAESNREPAQSDVMAVWMIWETNHLENNSPYIHCKLYCTFTRMYRRGSLQNNISKQQNKSRFT